MEVRNLRIGDILINLGYINEVQVSAALDYQRLHKDKRLGECLIELGYVSEKQVLEALADRLELKTVELSTVHVSITAVETIPKPLADKYCMLAVDSKGARLTVLVNDPLNYYALEDIRQLTGRQLDILLTEKQPLKNAIEHYYAEVRVRDATRTANMSANDKDEEKAADIGASDGDDEAPIIALLDSLIQRAVMTGASDIHIEPFEDHTMVRMRIDGVIQEYTRLNRQLHSALCVRIKILSNLDITERRVPQDGHFRAALRSGENVNIRVSMLPTVFGEKAVIRILDSRAVIDQAAHYGMDDDSYARFAPMLDCPNGIIFITGPTGSGKTTTLYMVLQQYATRKVNISTIEDPVEKNLAHVNQTQVNVQAGLTFGIGLRALLRQDPDVIMVGETRDAETASIAVRSAITGHVVFSTLHTSSAASTIVRLEDMGVERYLIASSLVGVVAQRLMRKNCKKCSRQVPTTDNERRILGEDVKFVTRGVGCPECGNTGFAGRTAIHEILSIDKKIRQMITAGESVEDIEQYAIDKRGMKTLEMKGRELVINGVTTPEELLKVTYNSN